MASPSSSATSVFPLLGYPVSEKPTRSNHIMWRAQLADMQAPLAILEATGGEKGKDVKPTPNPENEKWFAKDQTVLNYLLSNLSREILG